MSKLVSSLIGNARNSDANVPTLSVRLESDEFACGALSIAQAMRKAGEKSWLYSFTYVDPANVRDWERTTERSCFS